MKKLTKEQVLLLHRDLIEAHGGSAGIRDEGLLDSALETPFQTFGGQYLLPTIQQKVVRLGFGLIMNHPFVDGNKRIGVHVMLTLLALLEMILLYYPRAAFLCHKALVIKAIDIFLLLVHTVNVRKSMRF